MKGLRTGPPVTTLLTPLTLPLRCYRPPRIRSPTRVFDSMGLRGAQSPGASDTAEPRSSTRPSGRNPPCPVLCRAGLGWRVPDGCWMLDAGAHWDADCLGQGIRVGSWLADLFCCCTYNHVPPNFLNKTPIVYLFLLASARFSYSKLRLSLPATHHHCLRASWAPIFLFTVSLPGAIPLDHATCCLFCTTHHLTTLASHHISYPELPVVAPVLGGLAAERASPTGVSWQPMSQGINRPVTAHPARP